MKISGSIFVLFFLTFNLIFPQIVPQKFSVQQPDTFYLMGEFNNWQPIRTRVESHYEYNSYIYSADYAFKIDQAEQDFEWYMVNKSGTIRFPAKSNSWVFPASFSFGEDSLMIYFSLDTRSYTDDWYPKANIVGTNEYWMTGPDGLMIVTEAGYVADMDLYVELPGGKPEYTSASEYAGKYIVKKSGNHSWYLNILHGYGSWGKDNRQTDYNQNFIDYTTSKDSQVVYYYFNLMSERLTTFVAPERLLLKIIPAEAAQNCLVWMGNYRYGENGFTGWETGTTLKIKNYAGSGWAFDGWAGDGSGMNDTLTITMDRDKTVYAKFKPVLSWEFISEKEKSRAPPSDGEEIKLGKLKLSVSSIEWKVNNLEFSAEEKVKGYYTEAYLKYGNNKLKGTIHQDSDGYITKVTFAPSVTISKKSTLDMDFIYKFNFPSKFPDKYLSGSLEEVKKYRISISDRQLDCTPVPAEAQPGSILPAGKTVSEKQIYASVWNVSKEPDMPFGSIKEAVESAETKDNDLIKVLAGAYREKIIINKPVTIFASSGPDSTLLTSLNSAASYGDDAKIFIVKSDNVKITGFAFKECLNSISLLNAKNCEIKNNKILNGYVSIKGDSNFVHDNSGSGAGVTVWGSFNRIEKNNILTESGEGVQINDDKLKDSKGNIIKENVIGGGLRGIYLNGSGVKSTKIINNKIGTNSDGTKAAPNLTGILIDYSSSNIIKDNLISGNRTGIKLVKGSNNEFRNNIIGANSAKTGSLPNGNGIIMKFEANNNRIADNFIGGNRETGIRISDCSDNIFKNNIIGDNRVNSKIFNFVGGIFITGGSKNNIIESNIISNNIIAIMLAGKNVTTNKITKNTIGLDSSGTKIIGNISGIFILDRASRNIISNNLVSGNSKFGISIFGKGTEGNMIDKNKIGVDINAAAKLPNGNGIEILGGASKNKIYDNIISGNEKIGVLAANNTTRRNQILRNYIGTNKSKAGNIPNEFGVMLVKCYNNFIMSNKIWHNKTGIADGGIKNLISGNDIRYNRGNTGIHLNNSRSLIAGNIISADKTDGIKCENGSTPLIEKNNIVNNQGFGLANSDPNVNINASNNWWGSADGPVNGVISGNVNFSGWLSEPAGFLSAYPSDSVHFMPGQLDSLFIYYQNLTEDNDRVNVTISDTKGWLIGANSVTVNISGQLGAAVPIRLKIPGNTPENSVSIISISASSAKSQKTLNDSLTVFSYVPRLSRILVSPDSTTIPPNDSLLFTAAASDQYNNRYEFVPDWKTTLGNIDSTGLFKSDSIIGNITVTASDKLSGIKGEAFLRADTNASVLSSIKIFPDSVTLKPGESIVFSAKGYSQFNFPRFFNAVWSAGGGTIDQNGYYRADSTLGNFTVEVNDTSANVAGTAKITISNITKADKTSPMPAKYALNQNYPNPFNPSTTIQYSLPYASKVKLEIFNILGQRVKILINKIESAGYKSIIWNANNLASGIYILRIYAAPVDNKSEPFISVKKTMLVK